MSDQLAADLRIPISLSCYSREVLYRTCYAFTDRAYIWLEPQDSGTILVTLTAKRKSTDADGLKGEFGNALLDFAVREQVMKETAIIRDTLIKSALRQAGER